MPKKPFPLIIILVLMIFLSACTGQAENNHPPDEAHITKTEILEYDNSVVLYLYIADDLNWNALSSNEKKAFVEEKLAARKPELEAKNKSYSIVGLLSDEHNAFLYQSDMDQTTYYVNGELDESVQ